MQEVSTERYIDIPEPIRQVYLQWRPSPLFRARRLEKALDTPARIYYKYEGVSPVGSHKPNTAVPQVFYNKEAGVKRLSTETGAGQWGSALAFAGALFGLDIRVFMVRVSYDQKPYRRGFMETFGARCVASPSMETAFGRQVLASTPDSPGSLGIAISEAVAVAASARRRGHGSAVMGALEEVIRRAYDFGALSATEDGAPLYRSCGWQLWTGPVSALSPSGLLPTPDEDGAVHVLPLRADLDLTAELTCDWRDGDLW